MAVIRSLKEFYNKNIDSLDDVLDGATYKRITAAEKTNFEAASRSDFKKIKTAADLETFFPASGGVHTLTNSCEVQGTIVLSNQIDLNGYLLQGVNVNSDIIYYVGVQAAFTGAQGGTIKLVTLVAATAGGNVFNVNDATNTKIFIVRDCIIANSKSVGNVQGHDIVFFSVINFAANDEGVVFNNISKLLLLDLAWLSTNKATFESYTGTFDIIIVQGGFMNCLLTNSAIGFDVSANPAVNDVAVLKSRTFTGDGIRTSGSFGLKWSVNSSGIDSISDDLSNGEYYITNNTTETVISGISTPVKLSGTTVTGSVKRFTYSNNRLTYNGTRSIRKTVIASCSISSNTSNKNIAIYIAKNGSVVTKTKGNGLAKTGGEPITLVAKGKVDFNTGDYIELWGENRTAINNITWEDGNITI